MKRILVIGASRGIGLEVVREALGRGFAVRALARSADRMASSAPNFEKLTGFGAGNSTVAWKAFRFASFSGGPTMIRTFRNG
jgi:NAD(P)-dependent dehydrogenase (short-subunit alcohol dehydrogenase family)